MANNDKVEFSPKRPPKAKKICAFNGCRNNNNSGVHMHRFPRDKARCDVWVQAAKNEKLKGLPASRLNPCYVLCSDHFYDWCFMNSASKKRLVHNAIPLSPKPVPYVHPEPSDSWTGVDEKMCLEVLLKTPLPSQTLRFKRPRKSYQKSKEKLVQMKEELVDREEEPPQESPVIENITTTSPVDPIPVVNTNLKTYEGQSVKKPTLTFYPIISKVAPQTSIREEEEDEELELYLKLLARKLKRYKGLERRQVMHEIDGVFLRKQPAPPSTAPQFLMASLENSASTSSKSSGN